MTPKNTREKPLALTQCHECKKGLNPQETYVHYEYRSIMYGLPHRRNEIQVPLWLCKDCKLKKLRQEIGSHRFHIRNLQEEIDIIKK